MKNNLLLSKRIALYLFMFCIIFCITLSILFINISVSAQAGAIKTFIVVLDAGHGGRDGGAVSPNGVKESDINLAICQTLEKKLRDSGISVIMTRTTKEGLANGSNFKKEDMKKRKQVIEKSGADIVISVHLNKFGMASRRGAQVFSTNTAQSKLLGKHIQDSLNGNINKNYSGRNFSCLVGDYFILNCSPIPSVIAECGFLSNSEDERLLQTKEYQSKIVESLYTGAINYFASQKTT